MAVRLTTTKFEPFIPSVLSFALAFVTNIYVILTLYDFRLLLA